jgi:hypothetical protein
MKHKSKQTLDEKFFRVFVLAQKIIDVGLHKPNKSFAKIHLQGYRTGDARSTERGRKSSSSAYAGMRNMGDKVRRNRERSGEQGQRKKLKPDHFLWRWCAFFPCVFSMPAQPDNPDSLNHQKKLMNKNAFRCIEQACFCSFSSNNCECAQ